MDDPQLQELARQLLLRDLERVADRGLVVDDSELLTNIQSIPNNSELEQRLSLAKHIINSWQDAMKNNSTHKAVIDLLNDADYILAFECNYYEIPSFDTNVFKISDTQYIKNLYRRIEITTTKLPNQELVLDFTMRVNLTTGDIQKTIQFFYPLIDLLCNQVAATFCPTRHDVLENSIKPFVSSKECCLVYAKKTYKFSFLKYPFYFIDKELLKHLDGIKDLLVRIDVYGNQFDWRDAQTKEECIRRVKWNCLALKSVIIDTYALLDKRKTDIIN